MIGMPILTLVYAHKTTVPNQYTKEGITKYCVHLYLNVYVHFYDT